VAVGLGPGSYNGLRGAIALAQGWQLARREKLLGLSSVQCLAAQAQAEGITGRMSIVIDAQRGEFYLASYEIGAQGLVEVQALHLATREQVLARQHAGEVIVGPEVSKWFGASRIVFPRASMLGQLASTRNDFVPGKELEPIYLRETKFVKAPPARLIAD
jgi:tRNA threonylcarbamoyladenosine biosynthesis protein TsaB